MKLSVKVLAIVLLLISISDMAMAQPGGGGGGGGGPCPPWLPCIPITDHIEWLIFIMLGFFGVFKAIKYSRKNAHA